MKLTILNVAYPFAPVSCDAIGGAEQILSYLDSAICEAGHHSIMLACEGSSVCGELVVGCNLPEEIDDSRRQSVHQSYSAALRRILRTRHIDLIHCHGIDFDCYLPIGKTPALITLHLPTEWYSAGALRPSRSNVFFNCVSRHQRDRSPDEIQATVVENGVRTPEYVSDGDRQWVLCLGRICSEKGFHLAMDAAGTAGETLLIGGQVFPYPEHQKYFNDEIIPRLIRADTHFLGPIKQTQKEYLLAKARCLLVPSLAPETSSLVAMEAFACGTPVIAFPSGALPEIVERGRTGFIVNSVEEMAEAMKRAADIDPEDCRRVARERFSVTRMSAEYLKLYRSIVDTAGVAASAIAS